MRKALHVALKTRSLVYRKNVLMDKRGVEMSLQTIVIAVIAILVMIGLLYMWYQGAFAFNKELQECRSDYCAAQCGVMTAEGVAGTSIGNNEWCQKGAWDLTEEKYWKAYGEKGPVQGVSGQDLGLQCCLPIGTAPDTYLPKSLRKGETDIVSGIQNPPRIQMYFADRPSALAQNAVIEAVSEKEYAMSMKVTNMMEAEESEKFIAADKGEELENAKPVTCSVALLNDDGDNLFTATEDRGFTKQLVEEMSSLKEALETNNLCDLSPEGDSVISPEGKKVTFPSILENQELTLIVSMTEDGKYNQHPYETQFRVRLDVSDEIKIQGQSEEYVYQRTVTVSCVEEECLSFSYGFKETECSYDKGNATMNRQNRAEITVTEEGSHILCIKAETRSGKVLTKTAELPINIDHSEPSLEVDFNPLKLETTITCNESRASGSGCAVGAGVYYVHDITEFFLGECSTANSEYRWFPGKRVGENVEVIIPYARTGTASKMCVRVQDEAGNFAQESKIVYDALTPTINEVFSRI